MPAAAPLLDGLVSADPTYRPDEPPCLDRYDTIDLDAETTGLSRADKPVGWAVGAGGRTWYLPFAHRGGANLDEAVVKRWAERELRGKRIRNLHTKFDLRMSEQWGVNLREQGNTFHDVAHSEALLDDHETKFSLEALSRKRLGEGKIKLALPGASIADLPSSVVAPYARQDVALVRELAEVYAPLLAADDLGRVSALEDAVLPVCVEMERNGMPLDMDLLVRWCDTSQALLEQLTWELYRQVGFMVNPDAPTDMARLWRAVGEPIVHYTNGERPQPSFTAPIVQAAATRHPAILLAWRIGKLHDLRNKYLVKYRNEQQGGVLYPTLNQLATDDGGTVSGRLSCVRPNCTQIMGADKHKRWYSWLLEYGTEDYLIKRLFIPGSGTWFGADQRQVEFRIAAAYAKAQRIVDAYQADPYTDFHQEVIEMIRPYRPNITRTEAKTTSFCRLYGGGVKKIAATIGISEAEGAALVSAYDAAFPELGAFLKRAEQAAQTRRYVKTVMGRRARFGESDRFYSAANRVIQGGSADVFKASLVAVYEQREALGVTMRMAIHDELVGSINDREALEPLRKVLDTQRVPLSIPILWDAKLGDTWADTK